MRRIDPGRAGDLEAQFAPDLPSRPRLLGVLDGALTGVIWADDGDPPAWVVATESADGTTYLGGRIDAASVAAVFARLEPASGDIIVAFTGPDDPVRAVVPLDPYHRGEAIDFTDRVPPEGEERQLTPPDGLRIVDMTPDLLARTEWYRDILLAFGGLDRWLDGGIGRCLMRDDEIVSEAMAGPPIRGLMEMGVVTREGNRGRGYATVTCRHLARACEQQGLVPWWNTSLENVASATVARRLGFTRERRYDLVAYRSDRFS